MSNETQEPPAPAAEDEMPYDHGDLCRDGDALSDGIEPDAETRVFATLLSLIGGGFTEGRTALAVAAALDSQVSVKCALAVLRRYCGPSFGNHHWQVRQGRHGQALFRLLQG
ncbi:hypothetical protein [Brevundimonas sp. TWP2-3-2]|uniref:hypothetical protein n=1 Tax=Brevundimonas sp. TWP2-3-2 TaxID=2804648 RepID=UPI003CF2E069